MSCLKPRWIESIHKSVPCGKCFNCRLRKRSEWVMRLSYELEVHKHKGMFVTLTYDEEHIPITKSGLYTLQKEELQKFFKRLRRQISYDKESIYGNQEPIKYYACGEYGETYGRPHYHCIIIGLDVTDDRHKETICRCWKHGNTHIGTSTHQSMRYTVDYMMKEYKHYDQKEMEKVYGDAQPVFSLQSKGIGLQYLHNIAEEIEETCKISYKGKKVPAPRYFMQRLSVSEEVKEKNRREAYERMQEKHGINLSYKHYSTNPVGIGEIEKISISNKQIAKNVEAQRKIKKLKKTSIF